MAQEPQSAEGEVGSAIPDEIPTSAFGARSELSGAQLSPDGSKFALIVTRDEATYISVYDADTHELASGLNLGSELDFNWFRWAGSNRILFSMTGRHRQDLYSFSRLYSLNTETHVMYPLIGRHMALNGDDIVHIDPDGNYVLASFATRSRRPPAVWRFDLTGDERPEPVLVQPARSNIFGYIADDTGVLRIALHLSYGGRVRMRYRSDGNGDWDTVARARLDDNDTLDLWDFMGLRAGSDQGFSIGVPDGGERRVLMEFDFATGEPGDIVFQSSEEDVSTVLFDEQRNPIAIAYAGETFRREWLDPEIQEWRRQLSAALPQSRVWILDITEDRSRMLVLQEGPTDPGALYVFTPSEGRLDLFAEYRPQVPRTLLSEPSPIRYDARDGTSIHGYLTLPVGRPGENLPLIVHPHGGPFGIRDTDQYSDMVQLLANRGYAVIQPNFRGSGGYGESFELLGNGQIGRAMQDDLDDAVAYLVEQGIVDPDRVCIVGSSYGGFAAVWGAIRNPEIYRCAVSFAGVMHFERQLQHDRNFLFRRNRGRHWDRVDGDQTNFDLDDISPAVQVERLTRPVLLVHGEEDNRVPFNQYELMVDRAEDADIELETLTFPESGHGFNSAADETAYYDAVVDFLARHNPSD
ncbi:alpha/beta fold hydrolase [Parasphingopyxis sp.]|uniref:alpha/beta fold hydrolase n=1 Tax=Parasphingopyxis sp. TaxID=1920299 RepID=UPI002625DD9E|nr:alpha/beta fold hydrolase [Parasphingopyxis sp.]